MVKSDSQCPLWVVSGLWTIKRDVSFTRMLAISVMGHKRFARVNDAAGHGKASRDYSGKDIQRWLSRKLELRGRTG